MLDGFTEIAGAAGAWGLLGASAAVFLAGFMRGFVGFGAALVVVPVLSVVFSPSVAVPIAFLSGLPSVLQLLP
ncbi:MAG: sulfite exporter TauE/SafE family protein, partial [Alphaproteobacteria bacterium]